MISVEGLSFGYHPDEKLFEDETISFQAGVVTVVTGRSAKR